MHDEVAVGMVHGVAELYHKAQPFGHRETVLPTVNVDGLAIDVFHDQVRFARFIDARVEQSRDAGVLEVGLHLALGAEPLLQ